MLFKSGNWIVFIFYTYQWHLIYSLYVTVTIRAIIAYFPKLYTTKHEVGICCFIILMTCFSTKYFQKNLMNNSLSLISFVDFRYIFLTPQEFLTVMYNLRTGMFLSAHNPFITVYSQGSMARPCLSIFIQTHPVVCTIERVLLVQ